MGLTVGKTENLRVGELASRNQLHMSLLRWSLITVPAVVLVGSLMGRLSNSGFDNAWFRSLARPDWFPPGWVFGTVWTILYAMLGFALALILNARGAPGRGLAIGLFMLQLGINFAWSPLFFGAHQVTAALFLIAVNLALAIATAFAVARVRKAAAWLMVPYMAWLSFALLLNYEMDRLNPDAETRQESGATTITL